jgi:hypothetical protein
VLISVATKANLIIFGLPLPAIEPTIYRTEASTITISPPMRLYWQNGTVDFTRNWQEYKHGFGDVNNEHWLGMLT